jgi:hypothetical protein
VLIAELEFDDYSEEELAGHRIVPLEVIQILSNRYTVRRNRKDRSGTRQLIGETNGGRILTIAIVETLVEGRWRPITGWESSPEERSALHE